MNEQDFKDRTKQFGLHVIRLLDDLPSQRTTDVLARQLLRAATSIGANYRAACRGISTADVIAKLDIVEEETDEALYWLEVLVEAGLVAQSKAVGLIAEADELLSMTVASIKTLRSRAAERGSVMVLGQSKIQNRKSKMRS